MGDFFVILKSTFYTSFHFAFLNKMIILHGSRFSFVFSGFSRRFDARVVVLTLVRV